MVLLPKPRQFCLFMMMLFIVSRLSRMEGIPSQEFKNLESYTNKKRGLFRCQVDLFDLFSFLPFFPQVYKIDIQ